MFKEQWRASGLEAEERKLSGSGASEGRWCVWWGNDIGFLWKVWFFFFVQKQQPQKKKWFRIAPGTARETRFFRKLKTRSWEGYYLAGYLLVIAHSAGRQHLRTESPGRKNLLILGKSLFSGGKMYRRIGKVHWKAGISSHLFRSAGLLR